MIQLFRETAVGPGFRKTNLTYQNKFVSFDKSEKESKSRPKTAFRNHSGKFEDRVKEFMQSPGNTF